MNNIQTSSSTAQQRSARGERDGVPAKVLVVESNPAVAEMTVLVLAAAGHLAVQTPSGEQALRTQQTLAPDIILLDRSLKDMSAGDLCRALRARTTAPILVLTTDYDPDLWEALLAAGATECLPLPIHTGELLARISAQLRAQRRPGASTEAKRETTPDPRPRAAA